MRLKRLLFILHRDTVLKMVSFWTSQWGENSLLVVLSIFIGIAGAVLAAILHKMVHFFENIGTTLAQSDKPGLYFLLLVLPLLGISASFLVQRFLGGPHSVFRNVHPHALQRSFCRHGRLCRVGGSQRADRGGIGVEYGKFLSR